MKKVLFLCLALSFVVVASTAIAGTKAGMKEVNFQVQYSNMSADDVDMSTWVAAGKFGYFFTDYFSVGVDGAILNMDIEGLDLTMYSIGIVPNYYFNMGSNVTPYIGLNLGQVGFEVEDADESEFYYGGQIGVLVFVSESVAIDFQGRYTRYDIENVDVDEFGLRAGLSIFF